MPRLKPNWPFMQRSPGPWTAEEYASPCGIGFIRAANGEKVVSGPTLLLEDARFIVKACNAHDAFMKALDLNELPHPDDYKDQNVFVADMRAWFVRHATIIKEVQA